MIKFDIKNHWPSNETASGLDEADKHERQRILGVFRDRAVEAGAWCLVALFLLGCWGGLVALIKFLSK